MSPHLSTRRLQASIWFRVLPICGARNLVQLIHIPPFVVVAWPLFFVVVVAGGAGGARVSEGGAPAASQDTDADFWIFMPRSASEPKVVWWSL